MGSRFVRNDYHFVTVWRLPGGIEEISEILEDVEALALWWPSAFRRAEVLEPGGENGVGKRVRLVTRGLLPYRHSWCFTVVESEPPRRFVLVAEGDFVGRGEWLLHQEGPTAVVTFDWHVRADKRWIRRLSFLLKPMFALNHRWAMRGGEMAMREELTRRHAHASGRTRAMATR